MRSVALLSIVGARLISPTDNKQPRVEFSALFPVEKGHEGSISTTPVTTPDVWTRRVMFWKGLQKLEVEAIVVWTNG